MDISTQDGTGRCWRACVGLHICICSHDGGGAGACGGAGSCGVVVGGMVVVVVVIL